MTSLFLERQSNTLIPNQEFVQDQESVQDQKSVQDQVNLFESKASVSTVLFLFLRKTLPAVFGY
jgi:hypothetical protein